MNAKDKAAQIIIFANERVGLEATRQILAASYPVAAVFTSHPDRMSKIADYADFTPLTKEYPRISVRWIHSPKDSTIIEAVRACSPTLILVISWSQIIPPEILQVPSRGTVGIHYSLLPERRGGAPLVWALIDGLKTTGLTLFYYNEGIDAGDMIDRVEIPILSDDTVKTLLDKILHLVPALLLRNLDALLDGTALREPQDNSCATVTPPRTPKDGEIDWSWEAERIRNFVRAQTTPYPCAFSWIVDVGGRRVKMVIPYARREGTRLWVEGYVDTEPEA